MRYDTVFAYMTINVPASVLFLIELYCFFVFFLFIQAVFEQIILLNESISVGVYKASRICCKIAIRECATMSNNRDISATFNIEMFLDDSLFPEVYDLDQYEEPIAFADGNTGGK